MLPSMVLLFTTYGNEGTCSPTIPAYAPTVPLRYIGPTCATQAVSELRYLCRPYYLRSVTESQFNDPKVLCPCLLRRSTVVRTWPDQAPICHEACHNFYDRHQANIRRQPSRLLPAVLVHTRPPLHAQSTLLYDLQAYLQTTAYDLRIIYHVPRIDYTPTVTTLLFHPIS